MKSLLVLSMLSLLAACGPDRAPNLGPNPEIAHLQVGPDGDHLESTHVVFAPITENSKQTKYLLFKAPSNGILITQSGTIYDYMFAWGCSKQDGNIIKGNVSIRMKDLESGDFSVEPRANATLRYWSNPEFTLKAGDEVQVRLDVESLANCKSAGMYVQFAFRPTP